MAKVCPKCGEEKELTTEFWQKRNNRFITPCRSCNYQTQLAWVHRNIDKIRQKNAARRISHHDEILITKKNYYQRNKKIVLNKNAQYRNKNRDRYRSLSRERSQKNITMLTDVYICAQLKKRGYLIITTELIELYRQRIIIKRKIKQYNQEERRLSNESNCSNNQEK